MITFPAWGCDSLVACLRGMCEALSSNPSTVQNKIYHPNLSCGNLLIINFTKVGLDTLKVKYTVHKSFLISSCYIHDIKDSNSEIWKWEVFWKLKVIFWGVRKTRKNKEKSLSIVSDTCCVQKKQLKVRFVKYSLKTIKIGPEAAKGHRHYSGLLQVNCKPEKQGLLSVCPEPRFLRMLLLRDLYDQLHLLSGRVQRSLHESKSLRCPLHMCPPMEPALRTGVPRVLLLTRQWKETSSPTRYTEPVMCEQNTVSTILPYWFWKRFTCVWMLKNCTDQS